MRRDGLMADFPDAETGRAVWIIPYNKTLSPYVQHVILNGHKAGVLLGKDVPNGSEHLYDDQRHGVLRWMERDYRIRASLNPDVPDALTWQQNGKPVRIVFADSEMARKVSVDLHRAFRDLRHRLLGGESLNDPKAFLDRMDKHLCLIHWCLVQDDRKNQSQKKAIEQSKEIQHRKVKRKWWEWKN